MQKIAAETRRFTIDSFSFYSFFFLSVVYVLLAFQHGPRANVFVTIRSSSSSSSPLRRHFRLRQPSRRISRTRSLSLRITGPRFSLSFSFPFAPPFTFRSSFPEEMRRPRAPCPGPRDIHYNQSALQIVVLSDTYSSPIWNSSLGMRRFANDRAHTTRSYCLVDEEKSKKFILQEVEAQLEWNLFRKIDRKSVV